MRLAVIAFLCGILWVQQQPSLPAMDWAWLFLPLLVAAVRWPRVALPCLFLLAGILWAGWRATLILAESLPPELEGADLHLEGRILDLPSPTERGVRFLFYIERAWHQGQSVQVPRQVLLSRYHADAPINVGDAWRFVVRLKSPHGFQNPGGFDYEAYLLQMRIRATGYVREDGSSQLLAGTQASLPYPHLARLNRLRQQLSQHMQTQLAGHRFAAMVTAFANGDDDGIPDDQWLVLNRTGTSHLVAISGMNIGLVAGLMFYLFRSLWVRFGRAPLWIPAPRVAAVAALMAALLYAGLAGFAIPTQRALMILVVAFGAVLTGRKLAASSVLALSLLAVLLFDPLAVLSAGFWLSFTAVAIILLCIRQHRSERWPLRLLSWGRIQWGIAIGMLPLLLYLFQQTSVIGPVANLVAIPVIEMIVIPLTLLGVMADLLLPNGVAAMCWQVAAGALAWLWPLLDTLSQLPFAVWSQAAPPIWVLATSLIGILLLLAPAGFPARWMAAIWLLPLFIVRPAVPASGDVWLTLLDVGQGLSVVVRTSSHTLVYDTGARFSARLDAGRAVLVPFLRSRGIKHLETLIVSHGDNDQIGGSATLLAEIPTASILSSVADRLAGAQPCQTGQHWEWDGVRFEMLHPGGKPKLKGNNRSCVLLIAGPYGRILLPGDIAARAERLLVREQGSRLQADLLVAPHHGSNTSSTEAFLDATRPRRVLFPVGYRNRYKHPHPMVTARYRDHGILLDDTAQSGAIEARFTPDGMRLDRYRMSHRRYWHRPERLSASPPV